MKANKRASSIVAAIALALLAPFGNAEPEAKSDSTSQLAPLHLFAGVWSVKQLFFNAQGDIINTATGSEEVAWILDDRVLERQFDIKTSSWNYKAQGTFSWNEAKQRYEGVWFDNTSTAGFTTLEGTWNAKDRSFVFEVDGPDGRGGRAKFRTVDKFESDEVRRTTTYRVHGDQVEKISEIVYHRVAPCPGKMRIIDDR